MQRRATIVGASGFVGRRLRARLEANAWDVYAPAKHEPELLERDLGVVFYCAGLTADYDRRPFETVEAHVTLVSRLLEAGRFDKILYLSSTRLYDGLPNADASEAEPLLLDPTDPRRLYDLSKALGENLVMTRAEGRGAVARLANVYDWEPGAPGFLSQWLIRAASERAITLQSSPHMARDYIHLDDVTDALIAIADVPESAIYNVASGELAINREIAQVFEACGWRVSFADDAAPPTPPNLAVARLRALGVNPRPVKDRVRAYLEGLKR